MNQVLHKQNGFTFILRRSSRAKHFRIQIGMDQQFTIVVPKRAFGFQVEKFLLQHKSWIDKQIQKIQKQEADHPLPKYQNGDRFFYFGELLTLTVKSQTQKRVKVKVRINVLEVHLNKSISKAEGIRQLKNGIQKFFRQKAEEVIRDRLEYFNEHYGFRYNRVTLRNQKSRWGSCSRLKNLNFNWRLIMAPIEVIDYVVVHELCHLKQMNHSPQFWNLVAESIPNHKQVKKWLREKHFLLRL